MTSQLSETEESKEITIVLADDHKVVRQGLRAILEAEPAFRVIGEAGISVVGDMPWGTHFCQFFETKRRPARHFDSILQDGIGEQ